MEKEKRLNSVLALKIVKPLNMSWKEMGQMLGDTQYRLWRLANMAIFESYKNFHQNVRLGQKIKGRKLSELNVELKKDLLKNGAKEEDFFKYARPGKGALSGHVYGAFCNNELSSVTSKTKWSQVLRGTANLPLFRKNIAIPCPPCSIIKTEKGEYVTELSICLKQFRPQILLGTAKISSSFKYNLEKIVSGDYKAVLFRIQKRGKDRYLHITYNFPKNEQTKLNKDISVGVDLGFKCPLYVATNNGYARLGHKKFGSIARQIRKLQTQVRARRRAIQNSGQRDLCTSSARSGHGRNRSLQATETVQGKIDRFYTTLNHNMSRAIVEFAKSQGAGVIQIENLDSLKKNKTENNTFLKGWRIAQLQSFLKYKAEKEGIELKEINPCFTSRRCSKCGYIREEFTFEFRNKNGGIKFTCSECGYEENADYNAAKNIATSDISKIIEKQCKKQKLGYRSLKS